MKAGQEFLSSSDAFGEAAFSLLKAGAAFFASGRAVLYLKYGNESLHC